MHHSLTERLESEIIADLARTLPPGASSTDMFTAVTGLARQAIDTRQISRRLPALIRLAIKLNPYMPDIPALTALHNQALKGLMEHKMPALAETLKRCAEKKLPLPLIVSCEKYMAKARELQARLNGVWGLTPLIISGDAGLEEETYAAPVLTLPVADSYEALPAKMMEAYVFFHALAPGCGILKIDDDLMPTDSPMDAARATEFFASADYAGVPVENLFHDRIWHHGKCSTPVPPVYGKPVRVPWARGALYYLSPRALQHAACHYMRFPGLLSGEFYEDKALGDILHECGIKLTGAVLEQLLGLDSRHQNRV